MKIEIAESMVYSWLRHVKGCHVVQTNWKISPEWPIHHREELEQLMQASSDYFSSVLRPKSELGDVGLLQDTATSSAVQEYNIFKQTAGLPQLLAQTECDVLGIALNAGKCSATAVEVAFHENGLNYSGGRVVTAKKIVSKFLRIIFALRGIFSLDEAEIVFASPHVKPACVKQIEDMMDELNAFLRSVSLTGFSVSVLFNEEFNSEMLLPLVESVEKYGAADGAELFVRALKLMHLGYAAGCAIATIDSSKRSECSAENVSGDHTARVHNVSVNMGRLRFTAAKSMRSSFKEWLIQEGKTRDTANSYASGVATSSKFAHEELQWDKYDFYAMEDAEEVAEVAQKLLAVPAYQRYSKLSNNSRSCGLEHFVKFRKQVTQL